MRRFPYDPEKARDLLAEAGWKDRNGDGLIEDADGKPFTLTIRTNQGNEERKKIAEIIQQRLEEVGIRSTSSSSNGPPSSRSTSSKRRFEVVVLGLGRAPIPTSSWSGTPRSGARTR